ncbi:hypothetical protein ABZV61_40390 [Streptomyces sp900116325]|uniref:Uncharacterized protein n=1 Tax=Streptomyces sp. 900116325 TaxID=3154295 RepID=A0ABV2UMZ5_9ACTN
MVNVYRSLNARYSITVWMNASVNGAIAGINESTWKARSGTRMDSAAA